MRVRLGLALVGGLVAVSGTAFARRDCASAGIADADLWTQAKIFLNKEPRGAVGAKSRWKDRDYVWLGHITVGYSTFVAYEASSGNLVFAASSSDIVGSQGKTCGKQPGDLPGRGLQPLEGFLETLERK